MSWIAKILLYGILALATIYVMSAAIAFVIPYLIAVLVLLLLGKVIYEGLQDESEDKSPE
jgi:hypothetical protein